MRTNVGHVAVLVAAVLALTGCSDDTTGAGPGSTSHEGHSSSSSSPSSPSGPGSPTPSSSPRSRAADPAGTTVDITIKGGQVTPNGDRVKAKAGEPVTLRITADTAGEMHVHSTPEQRVEFARGTSTERLIIDKPGIVDVEDHGLGQVVVQLEVR